VVVYYALTGGFHAKFLRDMVPVTPFLCLWTAWGLDSLLQSRRRGLRIASGVVGALVLVGSTLYAAAFLAIYRQPHPWVRTTDYLCDTLPKPSTIMVEHWDDPLPLLQGSGTQRCHRAHGYVVFPAYDADSQEKLDRLVAGLRMSDYVVISTNRLYNAIPRLPWRYPMTSRYYELLMSEQLGFELEHYVTSYPELLGLRLVNDTFHDPDLPRPALLAKTEDALPSINLGRADESFTVYDHPKPMVFRKTRDLSRDEILALFGDAIDNLPHEEEE